MPIETVDEFKARQRQASGEGPVQLRRGVFLFANAAALDTANVALGVPPAMVEPPPAGTPAALTGPVTYWRRRTQLSHQVFAELKAHLAGRTWNAPSWILSIWGPKPADPTDCLRALVKIARADKLKLAEAEKAVADAGLPEVLTPQELRRQRIAHLERERMERIALQDEANAELDKIKI